MKRIIFVALLFLFQLNGLDAASLFYPVADSFVRSGVYASVNYGTTTPMVVHTNDDSDGVREIFLKFDISSINWSNEGVDSATLYFQGNLAGDTTAGTLNALSVTDTNWTENGITYNNKPSFGSVLSEENVGNVTPIWHSLDVSSYLHSEVAAGRGLTTIGIRKKSHNGSASINFRSRESSDVPYLDIVRTNRYSCKFVIPPTGHYTPGVGRNLTWTSADPAGVAGTALYDVSQGILATSGSASGSINWLVQGSWQFYVVATGNGGILTTSAVLNVTWSP